MKKIYAVLGMLGLLGCTTPDYDGNEVLFASRIKMTAEKGLAVCYVNPQVAYEKVLPDVLDQIREFVYYEQYRPGNGKVVEKAKEIHKYLALYQVKDLKAYCQNKFESTVYGFDSILQEVSKR